MKCKCGFDFELDSESKRCPKCGQIYILAKDHDYKKVPSVKPNIREVDTVFSVEKLFEIGKKFQLQQFKKKTKIFLRNPEQILASYVLRVIDFFDKDICSYSPENSTEKSHTEVARELFLSAKIEIVNEHIPRLVRNSLKGHTNGFNGTNCPICNNDVELNEKLIITCVDEIEDFTFKNSCGWSSKHITDIALSKCISFSSLFSRSHRHTYIPELTGKDGFDGETCPQCLTTNMFKIVNDTVICTGFDQTDEGYEKCTWQSQYLIDVELVKRKQARRYYSDDRSANTRNIEDSPYYNDALDMDQQSQEFWDDI